MPGLRLLLRMAPFVVGVLAASVWLRRRKAARRALAAGPRMRQIEGPPARSAPESEAAPAPDASQDEAGQALKGPQAEPARRFQREPIDIVTVVDDLLLAGR
jgi:hypothetical protein